MKKEKKSIRIGDLTGRVEKRYETSWTIIIELGYDPATKQRKRIVESYPVEKEEDATAILIDKMYELRHKKYVKRDNITLGQYLDDWLKFRQSKLAPKTYASYKNEIEKYIKPRIGAIPLQDLEPMQLQEYYYKMETEGRIRKEDGEGDKPKGLSQRTINYHHRILSIALKQAVKWKKISYSPALFVDVPTFEKREMEYLRKNELESF